MKNLEAVYLKEIGTDDYHGYTWHRLSCFYGSDTRYVTWKTHRNASSGKLATAFRMAKRKLRRAIPDGVKTSRTSDAFQVPDGEWIDLEEGMRKPVKKVSQDKQIIRELVSMFHVRPEFLVVKIAELRSEANEARNLQDSLRAFLRMEGL